MLKCKYYLCRNDLTKVHYWVEFNNVSSSGHGKGAWVEDFSLATLYDSKDEIKVVITYLVNNYPKTCDSSQLVIGGGYVKSSNPFKAYDRAMSGI